MKKERWKVQYEDVEMYFIINYMPILNPFDALKAQQIALPMNIRLENTFGQFHMTFGINHSHFQYSSRIQIETI